MDNTIDALLPPSDDTGPWNQDENTQRGLPPEEDLPQEGAYDETDMPEEVLARHAEAYRHALARQRAEFDRVDRQRRAFLQAVRDRAKPATPQRLCDVLQRVLSSDNARATEIASDALRLVAQIAGATGKDRAALVYALLARLSVGQYVTNAYDNVTLMGAAALARRCYLARSGVNGESEQDSAEGAA